MKKEKTQGWRTDSARVEIQRIEKNEVRGREEGFWKSRKANFTFIKT